MKGGKVTKLSWDTINHIIVDDLEYLQETNKESVSGNYNEDLEKSVSVVLDYYKNMYTGGRG